MKEKRDYKFITLLIMWLSMFIVLILISVVGNIKDFEKTKIWNKYYATQIEIYGKTRYDEEYQTHTIEKTDKGYILTVYQIGGSYKYIKVYLVYKNKMGYVFKQLQNIC